MAEVKNGKSCNEAASRTVTSFLERVERSRLKVESIVQIEQRRGSPQKNDSRKEKGLCFSDLATEPYARFADMQMVLIFTARSHEDTIMIKARQ